MSAVQLIKLIGDDVAVGSKVKYPRRNNFRFAPYERTSSSANAMPEKYQNGLLALMSAKDLSIRAGLSAPTAKPTA
jgi:hypothetical protein